MTPVEETWNGTFKELNALIQTNNVLEIHIPHWDPVTVDQGLDWIRKTIYEGYYVKWMLESSVGVSSLRVMKWEYGEPEPQW